MIESSRQALRKVETGEEHQSPSQSPSQGEHPLLQRHGDRPLRWLPRLSQQEDQLMALHDAGIDTVRDAGKRRELAQANGVANFTARGRLALFEDLKELGFPFSDAQIASARKAVKNEALLNETTLRSLMDFDQPSSTVASTLQKAGIVTVPDFWEKSPTELLSIKRVTAEGLLKCYRVFQDNGISFGVNHDAYARKLLTEQTD